MTATIQADETFSPLLLAGSAPLDLDGDRIVSLEDPRRILLVESGAIDLFGVELIDDEPRGRWTFLNRVERGTLLTGTQPGPRHRILGRPVLGSSVRVIDNDSVQQIGAGDDADPEHDRAVDQFVAGVEQFLTALATSQRTALAPREFVPLERSGQLHVSDGDVVRSVNGLYWVVIESGRVELADAIAGEVSAGTELCITERDWLNVHDPTTLQARNSYDLVADNTLWRHWITAAGRMLYVIDRRVERLKVREAERLTAQRASDRDTVATAQQLFDAVLHDSDARIRLAEVAGESPAVAAARLVGARGHFPVQAPPPGATRGRWMSEVQAVALASRLRTRNIRVDGTWWKRDLGPLVGYRKIKDAPVALLPVSRLGDVGYVLVENNEATRVNAKVADSLRNVATVLYRPLPDTVHGVRSLLRFGLRGNRRDLWMFALMGVLVAGLGLLVPVMTGAVLGTYVAHAERSLIVEGAIAVLASAVVVAGLSIVQNIAALRIESRSAEAMQASVWTKLMSLPASFFSRYSAGELGTTVLGVSTAQETLTGMTTTAILGLLTGLANLVLVFFLDLWLALLATLLLAIAVGFAAAAGVREVRWQRRMYAYEKDMSARTFQILSAVPKLRVAAAEERVFGLWAGKFTEGRRLTMGARRVQNLVTTFNAGFPILSAAAIFTVVAGPMHRDVPISTFLAFFAAFNLLLAASLQFTATAVTAMGIVPMLQDLKPILDARPERMDVQADPGELSGHVGISHLSFRYTEDSSLVLDDVTFTIEPGEFVAVVGPSGSGKSTLLRLLLGFESPSSGSVLMDGKSLAELDVSAVRRQCGVVLQRGALLAASIKTNIIGSGLFTVEDAWAAAEMAGIADDIKALPMGMNTVLSEGTNTFSGGQRQRLMIARALVSRPRILLLDEATSALDNPTQRIVAEATRKLNASRLVIAHRLSTIENADKIVVLDGGRIVQQGRYRDLLADRDGLFATLARRQM